MEEYQDYFEKNGYVVIKNFIEKELLIYLSNQIKLTEKLLCYEKKVKPTDYFFSDLPSKTSFSYYSSLTSETLLEIMREKIEKVVDKYLFPTYSYLRIYYKNSILEKHTDRPCCEYSATMCISNDKIPWDIWFETYNGEKLSISLYPGDIIIYKGIELPHWRNIYKQEEQIQVFLHYVDQNGPYKEYKFDKRQMIGPIIKQVNV